MLPKLTGIFCSLIVLAKFGIAKLVPAIGIPLLVSSLSSGREDVKMVAMFSLVKLGPRHCSRLLKIARNGHHAKDILMVISGNGGPEHVDDLHWFTQSPDSEVSAAATSAIESINDRSNS